jgi:hypothetical protein
MAAEVAAIAKAKTAADQKLVSPHSHVGAPS